MDRNAAIFLLLVASIALSKNAIVALFGGGDSGRNAAAPLPMLACAVCITSVGLALGSGRIAVGIMIVVAGLLFGQLAGRINIALGALLSLFFLLAYLRWGLALRPKSDDPNSQSVPFQALMATNARRFLPDGPIEDLRAIRVSEQVSLSAIENQEKAADLIGPLQTSGEHHIDLPVVTGQNTMDGCAALNAPRRY